MLLLLTLLPMNVWAQQSGKKTYDVELTVTDRTTKESIIMATVQLQPTGAMTITDADGRATLHNIQGGTYTVNISYVGYEPFTTRVAVNKSVHLSCQMTPTTLALREVSVVAKQNVSGASTSSIIGRQAIDHLQASSLADIMQLVPGQLMGNIDMTSQSNLQIRSLWFAKLYGSYLKTNNSLHGQTAGVSIGLYY